MVAGIQWGLEEKGTVAVSSDGEESAKIAGSGGDGIQGSDGAAHSG